MLLGHRQEAVARAVQAQLQAGVYTARGDVSEDSLCSRLARWFPCGAGDGSHVLLRKTGAEGVAAAVRLARAYTDRDLVARSGYHGWHDWCADGVSARYYGDSGTDNVACSSGIPQSVRGLTVRVQLDDLEALEETLDGLGKAPACLVVAPEDITPPLELKLQRIREITKDRRIVLILDEVKTGFRAGVGGVQARAGVRPDLTVVSKGLANGLPLAAVIGTAEIMSVAPRCWLYSTYQGELVSIAAALATLDLLESTDIAGDLERKGRHFIEKIQREAEARELRRLRVYGWPLDSMPFVDLKGIARLDLDELTSAVEAAGVLMFFDHMNFISWDHDVEDLSYAAEVVVRTIGEKALGTMTQPPGASASPRS